MYKAPDNGLSESAYLFVPAVFFSASCLIFSGTVDEFSHDLTCLLTVTDDIS